jgi:hypothetical protein
MKNTIKWFGIIALVTIIGFSMAGCDNGNNKTDVTVTPRVAGKEGFIGKAASCHHRAKSKGNMIEVLYNLINDRRVNVFHAFPCSDAFIKSLSNRSN